MADAPEPSLERYSFLDRLMHRIAFAHPHIQRALGEIESDIFADRFKDRPLSPPVFVAGLPRAGTTLLLEMLYATGEFSTFTYRQMPFLLAPLLWASISAPFQRAGTARERAHGDGVEVSFDSPEAFEEAAWLSCLRKSYVEDTRLLPISPDMADREFREFFTNLIRKLTALNAGNGPTKRYLSKNNANISRLPTLTSIFPDAAVFVCLRRPAAHVRSLMTQHRQFLTMHNDDAFARSYMAWIGHYDFGANFRPIDFAGRGGLAAPEAADANFWLQYWIDAYSFAAERAAPGIHFFCYENLFDDARGALAAAANAAALTDAEGFVANTEKIRAPTTDPAELTGADPQLLETADELYNRLRRKALG